MENFTRRHFRLLCDFPAIRRFLIEIYTRDWRNGVAAPFVEYALSSSWADIEQTHKNAIYESEGKIIGYCFYEAAPGKAFMSIRPGYEFIAADMADYAVKSLADSNGDIEFDLFAGQTAAIAAVKALGFEKIGGYNERVLDYSVTLNYEVPEGFSIVPNAELDMAKINKCCWKGFNHELDGEGEWDGEFESTIRCTKAPNATNDLPVVIRHDASGEYACFAGMWWTPENQLAYMEPLCTIPEYRKMGLAAAALTEMQRRTKPLGATHMPGGSNEFYARIGFEPMIEWTQWRRPGNN